MINKNNNQSVGGQLTIDYYNKNYYAFVESTQNVDFSDTQNIFMDLLPEEADILDFWTRHQVFSGTWLSCGGYRWLNRIMSIGISIYRN